MKKRPIDKSKKSNMKCEHCAFWTGWYTSTCSQTNESKQYYQRCKNFRWNPRLLYKEE